MSPFLDASYTDRAKHTMEKADSSLIYCRDANGNRGHFGSLNCSRGQMEIPDEQTEVADIRTEIPDTCMESPDTRLKNILYFQQLRAVIHRLKGIEDSLLAFL